MDRTAVYALTHSLLHAVCTESGQVGPSWHPHKEARRTGLMHMQHGRTGPDRPTQVLSRKWFDGPKIRAESLPALQIVEICSNCAATY